MRFLFIVIIVLIALSLFFAEVILKDPGYLLLAYGSYTLETSIIIAVIAIALFTVVAIILASFIGKLFGLKSGVSEWVSARSAKLARQKTTLGLIELAEGHWEKACKLLSESAEENDHPLINYLNAARAADELGELDARDEYLRKASVTKTGNPSFAVGLTQAQLQYKCKDWERCLATLQRLKKKSPKHGYVMKMLLQVFEETEEWEKLSQLIPEIRKSKDNPYSKDELDTIEKDCFKSWLKSILKRKSVDSAQSESLDVIWHQIPIRLRKNIELVHTHVNCLAAVGESKRARDLIEKTVVKEWSDELVHLYGMLPVEPTGRTMKVVEGWLAKNPKNAQVLLTAGRISLRCHRWDVAQEYFERCLEEQESAEVYGELGRIYASLGRHIESNQFFQQGLAKMVNGLPDLPMPVAITKELLDTEALASERNS